MPIQNIIIYRISRRGNIGIVIRTAGWVYVVVGVTGINCTVAGIFLKVNAWGNKDGIKRINPIFHSKVDSVIVIIAGG